MSMGTRAAPAAATGRPPRGRLLLCFGLPLAILAISWIWLAVDRGTLRLWNVTVHESGRYTLGQTIFYCGHFLREVPTDIVYALFVLAAAGAGTGGRARRLPAFSIAAFLLAAALVGFALVRAAATQGWDWALRDLLQMRTRDDLVAYGSHWRYHWLSTLWFGVAAMLAVPRLAPAATGRGSAPLQWGAWGAFVGLTLVFGLSFDIFTDVRHTGHQAREILTHGPITGLLAAGVVQLLASRRPGAAGHAAAPADRRGRRIAAVLFLAIPLYLAAVTLAGDPMEAGQSEEGLSAMVAGHVFEHTLDYVLVVLLVAGGYVALAPPPASPTRGRQ